MRSPSFLLYEDTARTDTWLKLMLGGILVMFLVLGGVLLFQDKEDAFGMFLHRCHLASEPAAARQIFGQNFGLKPFLNLL